MRTEKVNKVSTAQHCTHPPGGTPRVVKVFSYLQLRIRQNGGSRPNNQRVLCRHIDNDPHLACTDRDKYMDINSNQH